MQPSAYQPNNAIRFVTATSLYDGHDVSINIMRRLLQTSGVEVIHLGHNRSVDEIVKTAIHEDAQGIAVSSYQGGHNEFFKYMIDSLNQRNASHIKVFGGGGGVILPDEITDLEKYGVCKIFSPEDGRKLGLQGMINYKIEACDYPTPQDPDRDIELLGEKNHAAIARLITFVEEKLHAKDDKHESILGKNSPTAQTGRAGSRHYRNWRSWQKLIDRRTGPTFPA